MIKECVILSGKIINVGSWDYQKKVVEITPAEYDAEGNITKEAVFEEQTRNPLPDGAIIENRDFTYDVDRGWYETGTPTPVSAEEKIAQLEQQLAITQETLDFIILGGM